MSDLENFRVEIKEWLDKNCPSTMRAGAPADTPIDEVWGGRKAVYKNPDSKLWLDRMGEKGWTCQLCRKNMVVVGLIRRK